jgi:hypothetical protein
LEWTQCAASSLADKGLNKAAPPKIAPMHGTPRCQVNGVMMNQALLELIEREGKIIESEWIKYRDEVLSSFTKAPPAAHLLVLRSTFFAGAHSLFRRIVAGGGDAERRLRLIQAELEGFNAAIESSD